MNAGFDVLINEGRIYNAHGDTPGMTRRRRPFSRRRPILIAMELTPSSSGRPLSARTDRRRRIVYCAWETLRLDGGTGRARWAAVPRIGVEGACCLGRVHCRRQ